MLFNALPFIAPFTPEIIRSTSLRVTKLCSPGINTLRLTQLTSCFLCSIKLINTTKLARQTVQVKPVKIAFQGMRLIMAQYIF